MLLNERKGKAMKKFLSITICIAIVLSLFATNFTAGAVLDTSILYGDFDGDGKVEIEDSQSILKVAARLMSINDDATFERCDVNNDGAITIYDARQTLRFLAKLAELQPKNDKMESGFSDTTGLFVTEDDAIAFFNGGLNSVKVNKPGFRRDETADVRDFDIGNAVLSGITVGETASSVASMIKSMIVSESEPETVQPSIKGENCDNAMSVETENYVSRLKATEVYAIKCYKSTTDDEVDPSETIVIEVGLPDCELENISQTAYNDVFNAQILQENSENIIANVFGANASDGVKKTIRNCVLKAEFEVVSQNEYRLYRYTTNYENDTYIASTTMGLKGGRLSADIYGVQYTTVTGVIYTDFEW